MAKRERRTDNTMEKEKEEQTTQWIKEKEEQTTQWLKEKVEQTTQWPQDTKGIIRIRESKLNRKHNGHKIPKG